MTTDPHPSLQICLTEADRRGALAADVRFGLATAHKSIPSKWLYDQRGSDLFDQITRLPDYYPTRAERAILDAHADEIATLSSAATLVELGSGTSTKTRLLLDALSRAGTLRRFVAFDVSEQTLRDALDVLGPAYPTLSLAGVVGDFETHLDRLGRPSRSGPSGSDTSGSGGGSRLIAFLGGTIGNLEPPARKAFLSTIADVLGPGEHLLLGTDLVKDPDRLIRAYDDATGVTAAFEKNVLAVVNDALDANFDLDTFSYRATWSTFDERVEMGVVTRTAQRVRVAALDLDVVLAAGEEIRTEVSAKFHLARIGDELGAAGLDPVATWTDPAGDFGLTLARRSA